MIATGPVGSGWDVPPPGPRKQYAQTKTRRICAALASAPYGLTARDLADRLSIDVETVRVMLIRLAGRGQVFRAGRLPSHGARTAPIIWQATRG